MDALEQVYQWAFADLARQSGVPVKPPPFRVRFRPYAGLRSTLYDRGDHHEVRLGELFVEAPPSVHYSLACLLLARLHPHLHTRPHDLEPYRAWSRSPDVLARHDALRRQRGRKHMLPPHGQAHDLRQLFLRVNERYFAGAMPEPRLGWSPGRSRRVFGHQDAAHDAIVINRRLDSPRVPPYVVESLLHHELLHIKYGTRFSPTGRRILHPRPFREEERRFEGHREAQRFLDAVAARRIRL